MAMIERSHVIDEANVAAMHYKAGALANGNFNGQATKGALATDTTNGKLYINTGTKAATVWTVVGVQVV
jgi:hypothetical protein